MSGHEWKTPEIQALIDGDKTPVHMSTAELLIAAAPIAEGTAELGFTVEYSSAIAAAFISGVQSCWCQTCRPRGLNRGMIVCPDCGNKRCPRANNHLHACTDSNESGQVGSAYESRITADKPAEPAREWRFTHLTLGNSLITTDESLARDAARMYGAQLQSRTPATASQPAGEWEDEQ